jgi:hypothetical protein
VYRVYAEVLADAEDTAVGESTNEATKSRQGMAAFSVGLDGEGVHMEVLHGKTVPGVSKDLTVFAIVYTLVRLAMWPSATLQHTAVERISFLDALRWLGVPSTGMPLIAMIVTPARPYRVEPRVKKRRPKRFPFMLTPRQELPQQLEQQELHG